MMTSLSLISLPIRHMQVDYLFSVFTASYHNFLHHSRSSLQSTNHLERIIRKVETLELHRQPHNSFNRDCALLSTNTLENRALQQQAIFRRKNKARMKTFPKRTKHHPFSSKMKERTNQLPSLVSLPCPIQSTTRPNLPTSAQRSSTRASNVTKHSTVHQICVHT